MSNWMDGWLPVEYRDWVRVIPEGETSAKLPAHYIEISLTESIKGESGRKRITNAFLMPPKPKLTLPDVGPGAVLRYWDRNGYERRAVRTHAPSWAWNAWFVIKGDGVWHSSASLLGDLDDDLFTVELEGLA